MFKKITFLVLTLIFIGGLAGCHDGAAVKGPDLDITDACVGDECPPEPPQPPPKEMIQVLKKIAYKRLNPVTNVPNTGFIDFVYEDGSLKAVRQTVEAWGEEEESFVLEERYEYYDDGNLKSISKYGDSAEGGEEHLFDIIFEYNTEGIIKTQTRAYPKGSMSQLKYSFQFSGPDGYLQEIHGTEQEVSAKSMSLGKAKSMSLPAIGLPSGQTPVVPYTVPPIGSGNLPGAADLKFPKSALDHIMPYMPTLPDIPWTQHVTFNKDGFPVDIFTTNKKIYVTYGDGLVTEMNQVNTPISYGDKDKFTSTKTTTTEFYKVDNSPKKGSIVYASPPSFGAEITVTAEVDGDVLISETLNRTVEEEDVIDEIRTFEYTEIESDTAKPPFYMIQPFVEHTTFLYRNDPELLFGKWKYIQND
ncbi:MAG: hypothetical protein HN337_02055 [Deltaproteobacteria bacterium]|jgi:hypothetical protein|nr:hypothetical protein [Deltaproteobacteria bacterium]